MQKGDRLLVQPLAFGALRKRALVRLVVDLDVGDILVQPLLFEDSQEPVVLAGQAHESLRLRHAHHFRADLRIGHQGRAVLVLPTRQDT